MECSIKISLNSIIHNQQITLPANLEQLKVIYKKLFNLKDNQISKLKIYYMKQKEEKNIKLNLDNDKEYMNFCLNENPDIIQAEIDNNEIIDINLNNIIQTPNFPNVENNNNCIRCLENDCFCIPFIKLNKDKDNNFMIYYNCKNNHKVENIPINNYKLFLTKKLEDIICSFCSLNKEKDKNIRLYYCYKCKKYLCNLEKCNNNHEKNCDNNDLMQIEKIDTDCIFHGKNLIYYCEDCQISFCNLCKSHQNHKKKNINEIKIQNEEKKKVIEMIDKNLNELEIIYNNIKENLIKKLSNIYEKNKNILLFNKKIIENLDKKEINGEILMNFNNCKYIKGRKIENDLEYYNNTFKQIENYFSNEFFEFDEEKQKLKLKFWNKIPIIISFDNTIKKLFNIKMPNPKKILLSKNITLSQLYQLIKKDMISQKEHFNFLAKNKYHVTYDLNIEEIYNKYKADDDILYLTAYKEQLWG